MAKVLQEGGKSEACLSWVVIAVDLSRRVLDLPQEQGGLDHVVFAAGRKALARRARLSGRLGERVLQSEFSK